MVFSLQFTRMIWWTKVTLRDQKLQDHPIKIYQFTVKSLQLTENSQGLNMYEQQNNFT